MIAESRLAVVGLDSSSSLGVVFVTDDLLVFDTY